MRLYWRDIGIVPLLLSVPFMFYPKVLEGDTQPWVLIGALIALLTFRPNRFLYRRDGSLIVLSFLCVLAYSFRSSSSFGLLRQAYTYIAFVTLWIVCMREKGEYFSIAVKATIIIWFVVGLYQFLSVKFGYDTDFSGRYVAGRSGVPSLTAEASYYGSLSAVQLMYVLTEKDARNRMFVACAVMSVVLSGSILAMLLLFFPLWKLPLRYRVASLVALPVLVLVTFYLTSAGLAARVTEITSQGINVSSLFLDPSANLRVGHIYFTLFHNLIASLLLTSPVSFMSQYNAFASQTGIFINTGSDYILPAIGELVYNAGFLGVLLLLFFLMRAQGNCPSLKAKIERVGFIVACMLSPITLSNVFLIAYAQSEE